MFPKTGLGIECVCVGSSCGVYVPRIIVHGYDDDGRYVLQMCDYRSQMALDAGLKNPKHWAHAIYNVLKETCRTRQEEMWVGTTDLGDEAMGCN